MKIAPCNFQRAILVEELDRLFMFKQQLLDLGMILLDSRALQKDAIY